MEPEKKSNGAFVGLVIIIIILIIGGIYVWQSNQDTEQKVPTQPANAITTEKEDAAELNSLEADLETTNTETGVDAGTIN